MNRHLTRPDTPAAISLAATKAILSQQIVPHPTNAVRCSTLTTGQIDLLIAIRDCSPGIHDKWEALPWDERKELSGLYYETTMTGFITSLTKLGLQYLQQIGR